MGLHKVQYTGASDDWRASVRWPAAYPSKQCKFRPRSEEGALLCCLQCLLREALQRCATCCARCRIKYFLTTAHCLIEIKVASERAKIGYVDLSWRWFGLSLVTFDSLPCFLQVVALRSLRIWLLGLPAMAARASLCLLSDGLMARHRQGAAELRETYRGP